VANAWLLLNFLGRGAVWRDSPHFLKNPKSFHQTADI